jgi:4-azaleucine resistance transporter AzlC
VQLLSSQSAHSYRRGALAVLPLSIACAPWGLLAGSLAIDAGLTPAQGQGLSAFVFAGAAQIVAIGMLKSGASVLSILLTVLLLTSQHLLYGLQMRAHISPMSARWRVGMGFLLTDELFALTSHLGPRNFDRWYALGVGLTFYLLWNLFTFAGIMLGSNIPGLANLGLDFSIAATFIALIVPNVKNLPTVICVIVSLLASVLLSYFQVEGALILSGLAGMTAGFVCKRYREICT